MSDQDYWIIEAMEKLGGSFVQALAVLARRADHINYKKIKDTWPEYWEEYAQFGSKLQERAYHGEK